MATSTNNNPSVPFSAGPFLHEDIAQVGFQSLTLVDAGRFSQVCKAWNAAMQSPGIWLTLFDVEKIPRIEGRVATAREDLRFMLPRTYSAKQMAPLGRFVGIVPLVNQVVFEMFKTITDPYDPTKKMSETWVFVVEPESIDRDYNPELLKDLIIANGDFDIKAPENKNPKQNGFRIPYSLKDLKIVVRYPLAKKGEGPVFAYFRPEALEQCSTIAKTVKVTLMRKEVPQQSRNLTYPDQKERLKEKGHVLVPLCTRGYFDILEILNNDACPDSRLPRLTFSRTSNEIKTGNGKHPVAIGDFALGAGVEAGNLFDGATDHFGAAPAVPEEEVLRPLDIGSGH